MEIFIEVLVPKESLKILTSKSLSNDPGTDITRPKGNWNVA